MEINNEIRNSLCVFCLNITDNCTDACDVTRKSDQYRFFTLIIRHFLNYSALISVDNQEWCRNACKVISEITLNGDDNEPFFENVNICSSCEKIARKFSDLYHQMKELELRIDWEVGKLWDVMGCADKVMTRLEKEELETTSTCDGGGMNLGEFRNTLKQSCRAYLERTRKKEVPKVQLTKMMVKEEESLLNGRKENVDFKVDSEITPIISAVYSIAPPLEVQAHPSVPDVQENVTQKEVDSQKAPLSEKLVVELNEEREMDAEIPAYQPVEVKCESVLSPIPLSAEPPLILQEEDPLNPPTMSQLMYPCTPCSLPFATKFELFQHNMANHIGKYFASVQLSEMRNDQFNHYITNLLETILDTFDNADGENFKCSFCPDMFSARQKARNHLVVMHRPIVKEKLVELQKSRTITNASGDTTNPTLEIKDGCPEVATTKSKDLAADWYCSNCSLSFSNKWKLFSHDMRNHPEKYFIAVKLEFLTPHQFQNYVAHMLSTTVDEFQKVGYKYQCNYCTQLISARQYRQSHLVLKHRSVLNKKLVELQNCSNIDLLSMSRRMSEHLNSNEKKGDYFCNICEKVFQQKYMLNRHLRDSHPETFFKSSNLLPSSSDNNELFQTYVQYVLEKQVESLFSKEGDQDRVKCGRCSQGHSSLKIINAKSHLILTHRNFVAESLEDIQKSGKSIQEIGEELLEMKGTKRVQKKASVETGSDFHAGVIPASKPTFDCSLCSITFKNKLCLFRHDMRRHIEKYFSSVKLENTSNDQFKKIIFHLLNNIVDEFSKSNLKYQCFFCDKLFTGRQATKNHLVTEHRPILKEKLVELQNSGDGPSSHSNASATPVAMLGDSAGKRKRSWNKGKSRLLKKPSLKFKIKLKSKNVTKKSKRARSEPSGEWVIDQVPVSHRPRVAKVLTRCGGCGEGFVNVDALKNHLKGFCKVLRDNSDKNLDENSVKIEIEEWMDDSGPAHVVDEVNYDL